MTEREKHLLKEQQKRDRIKKRRSSEELRKAQIIIMEQLDKMDMKKFTI